jgi:hypothetical protein
MQHSQLYVGSPAIDPPQRLRDQVLQADRVKRSSLTAQRFSLKQCRSIDIYR